MITTAFRRRLTVAAAAAVLAGGLGAASHAHAADVSVDDDYWACAALDHVEVGTCVENPLPDLSGYPTVPDTLRQLLGALPV